MTVTLLQPSNTSSAPTRQPPDGLARLLMAVDRWGLRGLAAFTFLVGLASLWWPHGWDAGIFTWVADAIRHGGLPYRDAFDVKGPFTFYSFALLQLVDGPGMMAVRAFDLACMTGAAFAVAGMVGRFEVRRAGLWTAVFLLLYHYSSDFWNTAQPDAWIAACGVLGMDLLVRPDIDRRPALATAAALLLGMGLLQKPTYGVLLPLPALAVLLLPSRPIRQRFLLATGLSIVTLVPAAVCIAWFAWHHALRFLLEGYLTFNFEVARQLVGGVPRALILTALHSTKTPLVLVIPVAVVGAFFVWSRDRRVCLLFLVWIAGAALSLAVQRRWFDYHWFTIAWPLAPIAGIGFARALRSERSGPAPARLIAITALAFLTLRFTWPLQQRIREWAEYLTGTLPSQEAYIAQFAPTESSIVLDDHALTAWLRAHTAPDDRVFIWDSPLAYSLAPRLAPSRVGFWVPVVLADRNHRKPIPLGPIQLEMRAEFMTALDRDTKVVAVTREAFDGREEFLRKSLPELYGELHHKLESEWVIVDSARNYLIFRPRDGTGAPARIDTR